MCLGGLHSFAEINSLMASLAQERVLCKATDISAAAAQIPTWAKSMQYGQATCAQLARMSALPVLHFAGAQFAVKALSASTCLKVGPLTCACTLRMLCSRSKQCTLCESLQCSDLFHKLLTQPRMSQSLAQIMRHSSDKTQGSSRLRGISAVLLQAVAPSDLCHCTDSDRQDCHKSPPAAAGAPASEGLISLLRRT